jgi:hypothetical protein
MDLRIQCLCIDTTDPARLASFWQSALGWRRTYERDEEVVLEPPAGSREDGVVPDLLFLRVPEAKLGKNRLHLDLVPAEIAIWAAQATCSYSWRTPPRRSRRWMFSRASWSGSVIGSGSGFSGRRFAMP